MTTRIKTASGVFFDLERPHPEDVRIQDIVQGLEAMPRWTGHTNSAWTVADHSVLTWRLLLAAEPDASVERQLHVLLHDAHEAYIGDHSTPLKNLVPGLREVARDVQAAILTSFRLAPVPGSGTQRAIKLADARALEIEWQHFMHGEGPVNPGVSLGAFEWHEDWLVFPGDFCSILCDLLYLKDNS